MFTPISNTASAIRAFGKGYQVHAHNVANALTPDFHPLDVVYEAAENGGVTARIGARPETAEVDLAEEMVNQTITVKSAKANAAMLRLENQMIGVLLDLRA